MICDELKFPNGKVIYYPSSRHPGSIATYHCNQEYILYGPNERLCQANGIWSGVDSICRGIKIFLIKITHQHTLYMCDDCTAVGVIQVWKWLIHKFSEVRRLFKIFICTVQSSKHM